ncbi:SDR family NAD(P)-dependent oxidoreductase [Sphingobium phenoxybenzoativorans]|uniref:SDR family NAD(P)-dependent oxidoreductase n=1 Tax=Sphingobium phenoxybenzoativorans TaxID=1592790 RepID=UPI000871C07D|nr:SDR family oxidoreductase [Sphingobium phenoxybenzoativorans]
MGSLEGRCAIVTGAAYGIGFAAAQRFAREGAFVVIADIKGHEAAAESLRAEGLNALAVSVDVTSDEDVNGVVAQMMAQQGRIDILVNNAAISAELRPAPFETATAEQWHRIYDVNVVGAFRMCKAVSPHMRAAKWGRIINVTSGAAFVGSAGIMHYVASKGAIIAMTRTLANEFGVDNVLVNAVSPGFTITESVKSAPEIWGDYMAPAIAARFIKRDALAPDVANVMHFLATEDASFMTGQTLTADGGTVMH